MNKFAADRSCIQNGSGTRGCCSNTTTHYYNNWKYSGRLSFSVTIKITKISTDILYQIKPLLTVKENLFGHIYCIPIHLHEIPAVDVYSQCACYTNDAFNISKGFFGVCV